MSAKGRSELWAVLSSAYLSLLPAMIYLAYAGDFVNAFVRTFPYRGVGVAGVEGIDGSARTHHYVLLVIVTIVTFTIIFAALNKLARNIRQCGLSVRVKVEKETICGLVALQIMGAIKFSISGDPIIFKINMALLFLTLFCMALILLKLYATRRERVQIMRYLSNYSLLQLTLLLPIVLVFSYKPFLSGEIYFQNFDILIYLLGVIVLNVLFWQKITKKSGTEADALSKRCFVSAIPLFLVPIAIPLSNETQYLMSPLFSASPRPLCIALIILLYGFAAFLLFVRSIPNRISLGPREIIAKFYFPCLVAAIVIYRFHNQTLELTELSGLELGIKDSLHLGEVLLPFHQFISFGKIPFVDYWATHGLRDFLPQLLYYLATGSQGHNVLAWGWLNYIFFYLALYYFLSKIIDPFFSFVFLLFEPCYVFNFFGKAGFPSRGVDFAGAIFVALMLLWFFQKTNLWRFTAIWLVSAFVVVWRPDIGLAAYAGVLFVIMLASVQQGSGFIRRGALSFAVVNGVLFFAFILLVLIRNQDFSYIATNAFYFLKLDVINSHLLFKEYGPLIVLQYILFPLLGIAYVVSSIHWLIVKARLIPAQYALTMLAVFALVYSIRMLHFHSMVNHGFQFMLYPLLGSLAGFYFLAKKRYSQMLFAAVFCMFILISPDSNRKTLFGNGPSFAFMKWEKGDDRVKLELRRPMHLVKFLESNLFDDQTFYDFTSSADLFVLANREFFPFFLSPIYYAFDGLQIAFLEKFEDLYEINRVPYVLFRSNNLWDKPIGVDTPYRSFRIAEFIYERYRPFRLIDGYEVWISKKHAQTEQIPAFIEERRENFRLGHLAYQWGSLDKGNASIHSPELAVFIEEGVLVRDTPQTFIFSPQIDKSSRNYIHLRIRANRPTDVYLGYGASYEPNFSFKVQQSEKPLDYVIRTSTQWGWESAPVKQVWLSAGRPVYVSRGVVRQGD